MGGALIRDRVAAKVAALASARHVFANGSTDPAIAPWPQDLPDFGPHALVTRGETERSGGTGNQWVTRTIVVEWWMSAVDKAEAERLMDAIEDEMVVAFSADIDLGGAATRGSWYAGSEAPREETDEGDRTWIVWPTRVMAVERFATEMSA